MNKNSVSAKYAAESDMLFSPVLDERMSATQRHTAEDEILPKWPWGNHGAANAWAVLVGPSPGKEDPNLISGPQPRRIGGNCGFQGFTHLKNRNRAWLEVSEAGFGSTGTSTHRETLSALFNLSSKNTSNASSLSRDELATFSDACVARIIECRARVILAIERRVFDILTDAINSSRSFVSREFTGSENPYTSRMTDCHVWHYAKEDELNDILLIRSPSHPSRPDRALKGTSSMSADGIRQRFHGVRLTVDKFNLEFPPRTVFR
ncbi:MAG: hypothetical protein K9L89_06165 [Kiritimatiellales bacterium]|nr:hypothetical protein [Kiritimatiellales bacterium]